MTTPTALSSLFGCVLLKGASSRRPPRGPPSLALADQRGVPACGDTGISRVFLRGREMPAETMARPAPRASRPELRPARLPRPTRIRNRGR